MKADRTRHLPNRLKTLTADRENVLFLNKVGIPP